MAKPQLAVIECASPWLDEGVPEVGQRVVYCSDYGLAGVVKFVGATEFSDGHDWVGIMLDKPRGKNDGRVKDKQYFTCPPNHGLFMRAKVLLPEEAVPDRAEQSQEPKAEPSRRRGRGRIDRSDTVESKDESTPKSATRSRRMVQSAASQERLSIHVAEKQVLRTAQPGAEDVRKELRLASEERDMETLRRLLPVAAQYGVAEAEVASARHVFDFEVQAALFRELEALGSRLEDMSATLSALNSAGLPGDKTSSMPDVIKEQLEEMMASAVQSITAKLSEEAASLRADLRREQLQAPALPAESLATLAPEAQLPVAAVSGGDKPGLVTATGEAHETREPELRSKRRPKAATDADAVNLEKSHESEEKGPALDPEEDSQRSLGKWNRAVSVHHIAGALQEEMQSASLSPDAKVYEIEPDVIRKKGEGVVCPRDGRRGAAYVDCLAGADQAASASFMLSYTWGYKMGDITDTLAQYCRDTNLDPKRTYTWMCCFCINQHRVKETEAAGETVPFEDFKKAFGDRVAGIGKIVAMMAPWRDPFYIKRVWCDFEMYTATSLKQEVVIAMPPKEAADFRGALLSGGVSEVWAALGSVKVEQAEASVAEDRERILKLIDEGPGFHQLNCAVAERLQGWIVQASEGYLEQRLQESGNASDLDLAKLGEGVGDLLRQVGEYKRSLKYLEASKRIREDQGALETPEGANLLRTFGVVCAELSDIEQALTTCEDARNIRVKTESLQTSDGARLLSVMGSLRVRKYLNAKAKEKDANDLELALELYEEATTIRKATGTLHTDEGAQLLGGEGNARRVRNKAEENDLDVAIQRYEEAKKIRQDNGSLDTPDAARMLFSLASTQMERNQLESAIENFKQARRALELTGTLNTPDGAQVLHKLGKALMDSGVFAEAQQVLAQAKGIREQTGTINTESGKDLMNLMKTVKVFARKAKDEVARKAQAQAEAKTEAPAPAEAGEEAS